MGVTGRRSTARDAADVLILLVLGMALLALTVWLALRTGPGSRVDADVVRSFRVDGFNAGRIDALLREIRIPTMLMLTLVAMAVAALQRLWRVAIALPLLVVGANQTTQLLKNDYLDSLVSVSGLRVTMPSGHSTAALSLAAVAIIAAPRVIRPLACLLGGAIAGGAGLGTMAERWHRPADVIAAVAVVMIWSAVALTIGGNWVGTPRVRSAGFDRGVGNAALAVLGTGIGVFVLHRLGMEPMAGSRAHALAYGSLAVVGTTIGLGLGLIALVAERRIFRQEGRHVGG